MSSSTKVKHTRHLGTLGSLFSGGALDPRAQHPCLSIYIQFYTISTSSRRVRSYPHTYLSTRSTAYSCHRYNFTSPWIPHWRIYFDPCHVIGERAPALQKETESIPRYFSNPLYLYSISITVCYYYYFSSLTFFISSSLDPLSDIRQPFCCNLIFFANIFLIPTASNSQLFVISIDIYLYSNLFLNFFVLLLMNEKISITIDIFSVLVKKKIITKILIDIHYEIAL